jgi:uncharacterized coiled-coil protein SlyX
LEKPIARLVIKDLIIGDGLKQELIFTQEKVNILEQKVNLKDDIISTLNNQILNYKSIIDIKSEQLQLSQELNNKLQKDLKHQQRKYKTTIGVGGLGLIALFFILN